MWRGYIEQICTDAEVDIGLGLEASTNYYGDDSINPDRRRDSYWSLHEMLNLKIRKIYVYAMIQSIMGYLVFFNSHYRNGSYLFVKHGLVMNPGKP